MKGWIFDASPLILLGKIDQLHLIETLSPEFRVPKPVAEEILQGPPNDAAIKWLTAESNYNHIVDTPKAPDFLAQWDLGSGEAAVLSLGLSENDAAVVLDDLAARKFATTFQLPLLGTLGLLIRAKQQGSVHQLAPLISHLDAVGANLSQAVMTHALKLAGEDGNGINILPP